VWFGGVTEPRAAFRKESRIRTGPHGNAIGKLRIQRQKQLVAESDKPLELSADLKKRIDNSAPDRLSVDSLKEAAEIEKLAHKLHQQMKN
jgi:hypothetical protein